jgi:tRNA threonylcarbamoyladenosine biosynthesis protein TsaB
MSLDAARTSACATTSRYAARILALDTTSAFGSIALVAGEETVSEVLLHSTEGFGHLLFGHIEEALRKAAWRLEEIDCFAAAAGPGSFTGVRIGLAAVKGLAEALAKPAVAVSNLEAIAWHGTAPLRATLLDARRDEIYAAVYSAELDLVSAEVVAKLPEWLSTLPDGEIEFLSTEIALFLTALEGRRVREVPRALAGAIAHIAAARFRAGKAADPAALDANYVRRSDAELFWRE